MKDGIPGFNVIFGQFSKSGVLHMVGMVNISFSHHIIDIEKCHLKKYLMHSSPEQRKWLKKKDLRSNEIFLKN